MRHLVLLAVLGLAACKAQTSTAENTTPDEPAPPSEAVDESSSSGGEDSPEWKAQRAADEQNCPDCVAACDVETTQGDYAMCMTDCCGDQ